MNWRRIPGFSRYEISDTGEPRRADRVGPWMPGPCSVWVSSNGYCMTDMTPDDGRKAVSISIHRLVMAAFVRPALPAEQVRHLDGVKTNNTLGNLAYGTAKENCHDRFRHGTMIRGEGINTATLTEALIPRVVAALEEGSTYKAIAARFGVSKDAIGAVARGETWKHVTGGVDRRNGARFSICRRAVA